MGEKITYLSFGERCAKELRTEYTTLLWQKLLKLQETFPEKFLVSGFGADAPTFNAYAKKHGNAVLFILVLYIGTAFQTLLQGTFEKVP